MLLGIILLGGIYIYYPHKYLVTLAKTRSPGLEINQHHLLYSASLSSTESETWSVWDFRHFHNVFVTHRRALGSFTNSVILFYQSKHKYFLDFRTTKFLITEVIFAGQKTETESSKHYLVHKVAVFFVGWN